MRNIRLHFVVTGNDGSSGPATSCFNAGFTWEKLVKTIQDLNTMYEKVGVHFEFDENGDITQVLNAQLNEDIPFIDGTAILPVQSPNVNKELQKALAKNLYGHLVIYFRDYGDKYKDTGIKTNYSGGKYWYVRHSKGANASSIAHELAHYFHLPHTFNDELYDPGSIFQTNTIANTADTIKYAVESGQYTKEEGDYIMDGDRNAGILDTPPDPRGGLLSHANSGNELGKCGPIGSVDVPVVFSDGTTHTYHIAPDRSNIASYFRCGTINDLSFSHDQKRVIRECIDSGNRRKLIDQLPGSYTAVWHAGNEEERMVYRWSYDFFRMKYDYLWTQGWRINLLENHVEDDKVLYSGTFRKSTEPEIQIYNATYQQYRSKYDDLWTKGWRLFLLNNYIIGGSIRYTAVFRKSTLDEIQLYNWSYDQYRKKYDELWEKGWRLFILNNFELNGIVRYTAVFRRSDNLEIQLYNWSYGEYRQKYDQLWKEGWRLHILNTYRIGGKSRYTAVFHKSTQSEIQLYNWGYRDFRRKSEELWNSGLRLHCLSIC